MEQQFAAELTALAPDAAGVRAYHAGPDAGSIEGNFDFAVVADFDDADSYLAYRENAEHQDIIGRLSGPAYQGRAPRSSTKSEPAAATRGERPGRRPTAAWPLKVRRSGPNFSDPGQIRRRGSPAIPPPANHRAAGEADEAPANGTTGVSSCRRKKTPGLAPFPFTTKGTAAKVRSSNPTVRGCRIAVYVSPGGCGRLARRGAQ